VPAVTVNVRAVALLFRVPSTEIPAPVATVPLPVVSGRLPVGPAEVALGSQSAEHLGVEVGDRIEVASYYGALEATVTGTVVLPPLGPFESDRAAPGTGALLPAAFFDAMLEEAEAAAGLPPGSFEATGLTSFVGIDLRDGVSADEFLDSLEGDELLSWDRGHFDFVQANLASAVDEIGAPTTLLLVEAARRADEAAAPA
jgi:hypothetical protein